MRTLIVEDQVQLGSLLAEHLNKNGFISDIVYTIEEAKAAIRTTRYGVIILDRRLPDGDGLDLVKQCRSANPGAGVICLTALDATRDRIAGLNLGADDYIIKPFDIDEVTARIRAVVRRSSGTAFPTKITCGELSFDPSLRSFEISGNSFVLPRREQALLESLIIRARRVVHRDVLLGEIFGFDDEVQSNTLDSHVSRLRARLAERQAGVAIQPIRGVGYLLDLVAR